jgi:hypothetical protein
MGGMMATSATPLLPQHQALIDGSAISPDVAEARGYRSLTTKAAVRGYGFAASQANVPGLLIPIWNVADDLATYQYRPDQPRIRDGKPTKYETPAKSRMALDVPRGVRDQLQDPATPLWITEGARKADAAVSAGMCCIAILGVWNWRGRNDADGVTALADWELIAFKGRDVYLVFDSDVTIKPAVAAALRRLKAFLELRGARVHVVYLDPQPNGAKVGLDDFLAAGGDVAGLLSRSEDDVRPSPHDDGPATGPYAATPAGFVYRSGSGDQPLSNFTARIVEEVVADDGAHHRAELVIAGRLGEELLPPVRVAARRFAALDWVGEWGARPILAAGFGNRDRVREAIQRHSPDIARRQVYEHSGWRELPDHGWCYLHAGGAIGATGLIAGVDVALTGKACLLVLPEPPAGDALRDAVRACLDLLDVAPDRITAPLFGAVYRAVLYELAAADLSVFPVGPTGVFKTELTALGMQHFGAAFDRLTLPADWTWTENALERLAFTFKDALLVIDDFAPHGTVHDVARLHAKADRVLRGAGNRGSRGRMWADGTLRPDFPPRGLIVATGEDAPRGQSLRSRLVLCDVAAGDVDKARLTEAQAAARAGTFAACMAGFVQWLAPQIDALRQRAPDLLADFRAQAQAGTSHARTPDAVAHLALGWWAFLHFAVEIAALSATEAEAAFSRAWAALGETAARQADYQTSEEPARHFLGLLASALAAGEAHFSAVEGKEPQSPPAWGWRLSTIGAGERQRTEWRPQGKRAGWIDGDDLYLDLGAALTAAHRVGQATGGGVTVTPKTLAKRLRGQGFLRSIEREGELRVRRTIEGQRRSVLHLAISAITPVESRQSRQSRHDEAEPTASREFAASGGGMGWRDSASPNGTSRHQIPPEPATSCSAGRIGGIGGIITADIAACGEGGDDAGEAARASGPDANAPADCPQPWECGLRGPCPGYGERGCPLVVGPEPQAETWSTVPLAQAGD